MSPISMFKLLFESVKFESTIDKDYLHEALIQGDQVIQIYKLYTILDILCMSGKRKGREILKILCDKTSIVRKFK